MSRGLFSFRKTGGLPLSFLLLIFLPLIGMGLRREPPAKAVDKPLPAVSPRTDGAAPPRTDGAAPSRTARACEAYFNDHFGFRSWLLHAHNALSVACFGMSPVGKVLIGRQGWLFLARETETRDESEYFRRLKPFTAGELRRWRRELKKRRDWLADRHIAYLFLIVPNKSTIYPEHMPSRLRPMPRPSRLDQLLAELGRERGFPVLDLRAALRRRKGEAPLYYRSDTHWNELGAFFGFEAIMAALTAEFPGLATPALEEYALESREQPGGDLARMLILEKRRFRETALRLRPKFPLAMKELPAPQSLGPNIRRTISECPSAPLPSLLMVHDSFALQLKPFLSSRFRRADYIWDWGLHFFPDLIERERPTLFIDQIAERMLCDMVLKNPPGVHGRPGGGARRSPGSAVSPP